MKIENRQRFLAIVAIAGIALLASDRLIISPLATRWKERSDRIAELKNSVSHGAQLLDREQTIRARWEGMMTHTLSDDTAEAENEVLQAFERWSQESRISISSIKPQWRRNHDDYMTLECRADAFGSIQAVTRFLYEVERDPLALKVEAVEIAPRDNDGQQLSLGLQVSGLVLSLQEQP
jgi:hypothetical protein